MIRHLTRFGSDHGALRSEDEPLLTGRGQFTDDLNMPGPDLWRIRARARSGTRDPCGSTRRRARAMPGVVAVITGADLAADGLGGIPPVASTVGRDGKPMVAAAMPVLAIGSHSLRRRSSGAGGRRNACAGAGRGRAVLIEIDELALRVQISRARWPKEPRGFTITCRAISRWTGATATSRRSMRPSPGPRMSSACGSTTRGLRRSRWSRAPESGCGTRRPSATR